MLSALSILFLLFCQGAYGNIRDMARGSPRTIPCPEEYGNDVHSQGRRNSSVKLRFLKYRAFYLEFSQQIPVYLGEHKIDLQRFINVREFI